MNDNPFTQPISEQIWEMKYKLSTPNPDIKDDVTVEDTWSRIAHTCAESLPELNGDMELPVDKTLFVKNRYQEFYGALEDFKFLPAGRITAGAGSARSVTLFNCFVMGVIPDSLSGIFDMLKEAALTMQQGGGIGYDFSPIRPKGATVKGVDADASGPTSFMDVWDSMCKTILSAGGRRGAMMATCSCSHPDIMDFTTAKRDSSRLRNFNVSVLASDKFMEAVIHDNMWALVHDVAPTDTSLGKNSEGKWIYEWVQAQDLWDLMMESTFGFAEPGVLFEDRINKMNNLWAIENITATNPCGEQPLPPYGACLLGSINLVKMVKDAFKDDARIDYELLIKTVRTAVQMLDSIIDTSKFPLEAQRTEALAKRRMGLGVTGLADMLFMLNCKYGTKDAEIITDYVMRIIAIAAYEESILLAAKFGPCPVTETFEQRTDFCTSGFMQGMPSNIRDDIMTYGIRNALLLSIAPTGTISLYAGNVSSGIEPIFAESYVRKVLQKDGTKTEELVEDYAVKFHRQYCENLGLESTDTRFTQNLVTAQTLTPHDHLVMQAAAQRWIDSSISKTINCPEDISYDDFVDIYMQAYKLGLKGCTTYRPNDVTGSVLSIVDDKSEEEAILNESPAVEPTESNCTTPTPRMKILNGQTYKLKWENSNYYVTINNEINESNELVPFEIFINTKEVTNFPWVAALTRMMSAVFRRGGNFEFVVEELKSVFDPAGGGWVDGKYVPSFIALLGTTVETHLASLKDSLTEEETTPVQKVTKEELDAVIAEAVVKVTTKPLQCTSCKGFNVNLSGGCPTCGDCGHSKCG